MKVREIPLDRIFITKNVRLEADDELGELMDSVEHYDLLQPIGVFPRGERFELVFGHRRFKSAQMRNEQTIAAHILEHLSEHDIPLVKLQENMQRKQLTTEEIVAAADELKRRRPELSDRSIDIMLGKRPGYLSQHRSTLRTYQWLAQRGLKKQHLLAMTADELSELRAKLEEKESKPRKGTFHRGDRIPAEGIRVMDTGGPNVVVVCSSKEWKQRVLRCLKQLMKEVRAA